MSDADGTVVDLDGVTKVFGEVTAVDGLTCTVDRGDVLGLLGHNGAGKTTTLRLISGVLTPTSGTLGVFGMDPVTQGAQVRRRTGVMLARPPVDRRMTGRENLEYTARLYGLDRSQAHDRLEELVVSFHLDDRLDDLVDHYSEGMVQRLSLARMLLPDPALLLLDEPTATLDPMAAHAVRQLIVDLAGAQERTIIVSTHDLIEASQICDRVAVLQRGALVALGRPQELAGRVAARGLRLQVAETHRPVVSKLAIDRGYTVEPMSGGEMRVHGVGYERVPQMVRALVDADIDVYGVMIDQPTLTDFYLALHQEDDAPADAT
ncbi:MAG: ABC transporter ATP-binding protein [Actinobacteria bacterium]|nr:ABC transporter ATP-binding protein [Actinomycetota bacterium]